MRRDGWSGCWDAVEWCKPKWKGLGWRAWNSLQGCDWGQPTSSELPGDAAKGSWSTWPKLLLFCCCWARFACSSSKPAKPAASQREAEKLKTASHSGPTLKYTRFIQRPPVLTITTCPALHSGPITRALSIHWLQSRPCLPFQQLDSSNMAPLILHNVPDEERYVGDDGIQRPYAMVFPQYVPLEDLQAAEPSSKRRPS